MRFLRKSIRINALKCDPSAVRERLARQGWQLTPVPWCEHGFWARHTDGRLDLGNTIEHALGYYYVQEAASMLPPEVMELTEDQLVLDLCAAPGSKSTQIAQRLKGSGLVVCNEFAADRIPPLGMNVQRMGAMNTVLTRADGRLFRLLGETFDRVLVDAPCSGTGAIRKSLHTLLSWNPASVRRLGWIQSNLLEAAYACVKNGGVVVYSTCTLEPEENEGVISAFLTKHEDAEVAKIDLPIKRSAPVAAFGGREYDSRVERCLRIWPEDNDTEGFFVAKLRKTA